MRHTTLANLAAGSERLTLLPAVSELTLGEARFSFGLTTPQGGFLTGGVPEVWAALTQNGPLKGPFPAAWHNFTGYGLTKDHSPVTELPGFYTATIDLPRASGWWLAASVEGSSRTLVGFGKMKVAATGVPAEVGARAIPVRTPVATTDVGLRKVCSRDPPCHMHYASLDRALAAAGRRS